MHRALKIVLFYLSFSLFMMPKLVFATQSPSLGQWQLLSLFEKGGAMMYPILFSSVLMLGIAIERGYSLRRKNIIEIVIANWLMWFTKPIPLVKKASPKKYTSNINI